MKSLMDKQRQKKFNLKVLLFDAVYVLITTYL